MADSLLLAGAPSVPASLAWMTGAAIASYLIIRLLLATRLSRRFADQPNERSLHTQPVPRIGGAGVVATALGVGVLVGFDSRILAAMFALAAVSLLDDWRGLPAAVRFTAHFIAALSVIPPLFDGAAWGWIAVMVIAVAWMTNLYNFMDGSDGLAGGMAVFGFGAYAIAAALAQAPPLSLFCACIAAAAGGFLLFNFPPARVFMGDVGSIPLGFLAGVLGVVGIAQALWPLWFPIVVFLPFAGDASVTLARRLARGERVWQAHRSHYYQRLVRSGLGHARVAALEYCAMALAALGALAALRSPPATQAMIIAAVIAAHLAAAWLTDRRWARYLATVGGVA